MAKTWYPVIDYLNCSECGTCVITCPNGVYDVEKAPSPVVRNPAACIEHCHRCGNRCPVGAITYIGEETGWMPPTGSQADEEPCCTCGREDVTKKKVVIDYLYLDLQSCDRCIGTDGVLDEVMMILTPALKLAGCEVVYNKIEIETEEFARKYQFLSSPTIRVNGIDICRTVAENSCGCCSEISESDVDCRVFEYNGETYEVPPKEMLAEAILRIVFGLSERSCTCSDYELPENLKTFFRGKKNTECSCGGKCC